MPADYSYRSPRDLELAMRFVQVDSSWYENYWLEERKARPAGMVARNLPTIVSCLRLACVRVASVGWMLGLRQKSHPEYSTTIVNPNFASLEQIGASQHARKAHSGC